MNPAILADLLGSVTTAFQDKDVESLLRLFSSRSTATYAGSRPDEKATGLTEIRRLLWDVLSRPAACSFKLCDVLFSEQEALVWLLAEGDRTETGDDGVTASFPYRLSGVLTQEEAGWRWLVLVGSEPEAAYEAEAFGEVLPARPPAGADTRMSAGSLRP
jgi:SnoaL-like domain